MTEKFLTYKDKRDVVFFLGAGASYAGGMPLQKEILPKILDPDSELASSKLTKELSVFLHKYFTVDIENAVYPRLESVFEFLDMFLEQKEALGGGYTLDKLSLLHESLVKLIHISIGKSIKSSAEIHEDFWSLVGYHNTNISVITTNYDTLIEESFERLYPNIAFLDYCIPLMNYDHYAEIDAFDWWVDPRGPVHVPEGAIPAPIKLLKLHGSLNWKYCDCCNQVLLTPWDIKLDPYSGDFRGYDYEADKTGDVLVCPLDGNFFKTLIVPPTHFKRLSHPAINLLMMEAAREIRCAKTIVFVGYSFPDADVHLKALLHKNIRSDCRIIVLDKTIDDDLKQRYLPISRDIHFQQRDFQSLVDNKGLMNVLLKPENPSAWSL